MSMSRRLYAIAAIVLATVMFVALNIALDASVTTARLDLTENHEFTLSQGTRNTIAKIEEPITLKFFYSKKVAADYAQIQAYATRVRDLLHEYAALSGGKIVLQEIDPEPFTPEEDEAVAAGLTGAPTDNGDMVYFGLSGTNSISGKEDIAFFSQDREAYLEYDLTSIVYRLSTPVKPVLGIITSLPLDVGAGGMMAAMQGQSRPYVIYQELEQSYKTKMLDPNFASIPSDVEVLMIAQPGALNDKQLYAIDQFVLRGGRALVFVDPYSEIAGASGGQSGSPIISDLPRLFKAWGVHFTSDKVIGDRALAAHVQVSDDPRNPVAEYPIWLHLTSDNFDANDPLTANLQALNIASAGALSPINGATTHFAPLVRSSNEASLIDATQARLNPQPQTLMEEIRPTGQEYVIAARISGLAKTAFPEGPPQGTALPQQIKESKGAVNLVVVSDSDLFDDRFWVRLQNVLGRTVATPIADNGAFVLNAVENLMGSNDLISLRTRVTNDRPFTRVSKIQAEAQAQFQSEADTLKQKMADTENRLRALQQGSTGKQQAAGLTPEQNAEIDSFRRELLDTRTQLRDVQHNLRKDIDRLGAILAFVNIALVPLLVAGFAILLAVLRRRKRARALSF